MQVEKKTEIFILCIVLWIPLFIFFVSFYGLIENKTLVDLCMHGIHIFVKFLKYSLLIVK